MKKNSEGQSFHIAIKDIVKTLGGWKAAWSIMSPRISTVILCVVVTVAIILFPSEHWEGDLLGSKSDDETTVTETMTPPVIPPVSPSTDMSTTQSTSTPSDTTVPPTSDSNTVVPTEGETTDMGNTDTSSPYSAPERQTGNNSGGYEDSNTYQRNTPRQQGQGGVSTQTPQSRYTPSQTVTRTYTPPSSSTFVKPTENTETAPTQ